MKPKTYSSTRAADLYVKTATDKLTRGEALKLCADWLRGESDLTRAELLARIEHVLEDTT